jgi:hypothetical protein
MDRQKEDAWREAMRRCHLNDEEVRMARELGFQPKSLIKNIPSRSQPWKAPVNEWVRSLYEKKIGSRRPGAAADASIMPEMPSGEERRNAEDPWPDNPHIPDLPPLDLDAEDPYDEFDSFKPLEDDEIEEEEGMRLRRQRLFRWVAQAIAVALSRLPEEKLAAFGAASQPLEREVPRFRRFRRRGIELPHECADLDLAVWLHDLSKLKSLKNAMARGLQLTQDTPYGGVAHHQVDMHVFDFATGRYQGRLCIFGQCPKPGKRECLVPGCGAQPFLQQFRDYRLEPARFAGLPKVMLFDRSAGFLVAPPRIDGTPRELKWTRRSPGDDMDDDVPF